MLSLSALLLCLSAAAQENFYVIDGQHVENFDGSQLEGKKIKHYEIKYLPDSKTTIHNIFTTDDWEKIEGAKVGGRVSIFTKEQAEGYARYGDNSPADRSLMAQLGFDFNWNATASGSTFLRPGFQAEILETLGAVVDEPKV